MSWGGYSRDKENHLILNFLHDNKFIHNSEIDSILEELVINEAKRGYSILTKNLHSFQKYPDHLDYPECFAYAIQNKTFLDKELKKIKFDHGETSDSFVKLYSHKNLLNELKEELLNPKPIPSFSKIEGYCLEHGTCFEGH